MTPIDVIRGQKVVGIVRTKEKEEARRSAIALLNAGVHAVEVSLVTPGALDVIAELVTAQPDATIGVGTVLTVEQVNNAHAAGARFVVSPTFDAAVVRATRARGMGSVPGAATPTEAQAAHTAGADLVKIFPASTWSPAAVRDLLAALPHLQLVPTGGVTVATATDWIRAGAVAVGLGSSLATAGPAAVATLLAELVPARHDVKNT